MNKYDIWVEGYLATGMEGIPAKAQKLASNIEANSFIEAVNKWYKSESDALNKHGTLSIRDNRAFLWGCEVFSNEAEARKSFG